MNLAKSLAVIFILFSIFSARAQTNKKVSVQTNSAPAAQEANRRTPAFAEVLLRQTELESDLEDLLASYTEDYPKVKETRYELDLINKDLAKILAVNVAENSKLTLALGKLIIRRDTLETDLWTLRARYGDEHPDVKRASRKAAIFEKAVREIMPEN